MPCAWSGATGTCRCRSPTRRPRPPGRSAGEIPRRGGRRAVRKGHRAPDGRSRRSSAEQGASQSSVPSRVASNPPPTSCTSSPLGVTHGPGANCRRSRSRTPPWSRKNTGAVGIPGVLVTPDGRQRMLRQQGVDPAVPGPDREGVAVEEDDPVGWSGAGSARSARALSFSGCVPSERVTESK